MLLIITLTGCVSYGHSSPLKQDIKKLNTLKELKIYDYVKNSNKTIDSIKIRPLKKCKKLDKECILKLDNDRRYYKKLAETLKKALKEKNIIIAETARIIYLLELENKITRDIAINALNSLEKKEIELKIENYYGKGISIIAILALIGLI